MYNHNDDDDDEQKNLNPIVSKNKARTDLRNLLTQRSIQSFVYLLNQVHDVHTRNWIEQVVDVQQLDGYHGTGALNMTRFPSWDSFFLEIITMEKETIVIERQDSSKSQQTNNDNNKNWANKGGYLDHLNTKTSLSKQTSSTSSSSSSSSSKPRSTRGSSSNYLANLGQQAQEPKKYTANEKKKMKKPSPFLKPKWQPGQQPSQTTTTTTTTKNSNNSYLESLNANVTAAETNKNESFETTNTNKAKSKSKTKTISPTKTIQTYEIDVDPASLVHRLIAVREQLSKEWVQDLETMYSTNDEILNQYLEKQLEARSSRRTPKDKDDEEDNDDDDDETIMNTKPHALFNNSIVMLANSIANGDRESSPFRRSNFDLLLLLSTQESVHRVLQEYQDEGETANFDWLKAFYTKRVAKFFDGHGIEYGRADEFLEELLVAPPTAQRTNNKEGVRFIDPMAMVEDIIRERSEVAREWKDIASEIPSDHTDLRRLLLTRRMMEVDGVPSFFKSSSTSTESKTKKTEEEDLFKEAGAFE